MLATFTALCEELHLCVVVFQQYNDKRYKNSLLKFMLCIVWSYLLTPWCRVLLEQLTGLQLVKKFPAFHGTRRFITALTSVRHLSLSWASPIQSIYPHPTSWKSILILYTHLRLGLPSGLLPSGFPSKTLFTPVSSPIRATCPTHLILLYFITHKYRLRVPNWKTLVQRSRWEGQNPALGVVEPY